MPRITLEQLENKVKRQDLQIENLKVALQKMRAYSMQLEKKIARAQEASRVNQESFVRLVRKLNDLIQLNERGD